MDFSRQKDEIEVLENIYRHEELSVLVLKSRSEHHVKFNAFQTAPQPITLLFTDLESDNACGGGTEVDQNMLSVSYLPPIELNVLLPKDYPSKSPPCYNISCMWLSSEHLQSICDAMDKMWRNCEVLYEWCQFLKDEVLSNIACNFQYAIKSKEIVEELEVNNNEKSHPQIKTEPSNEDESSLYDSKIGENSENFNQKYIREKLESYNVERELYVFNRESFECIICFEFKAGLKCVRLEPCRHVYCRDCIRSYLQTRIAEGSVYKIMCPTNGCDSQILFAQVGEIVSKDEFERYEQLLVNTMLEMDANMVRCPRLACQHPCTKDKDPKEKLAVCPRCKYAFCVQCNKGYHGVEDCLIKHHEKEALVKEYMDANRKTKLQMEEKYGKKKLLNLVQTSLNEKWIGENSKKCPKCRASIEKTAGCNKMVCNICLTIFCWTCLALLDVNDPYNHFSDIKSPCYNMLFDGLPPDDFFEEDVFFEDEVLEGEVVEVEVFEDDIFPIAEE